MTPEQIDHINLVNWFRYTYPELADDLIHIANERSCSPQHGRLLKRLGVKKGVSDLFLSYPINNYHGLWVELKVGKGKLSPEQIEFLERKAQRGYQAIAVWGFDAAKEYILTYLKDYNKK